MHPMTRDLQDCMVPLIGILRHHHRTWRMDTGKPLVITAHADRKEFSSENFRHTPFHGASAHEALELAGSVSKVERAMTSIVEILRRSHQLRAKGLNYCLTYHSHTNILSIDANRVFFFEAHEDPARIDSRVADTVFAAFDMLAQQPEPEQVFEFRIGHARLMAGSPAQALLLYTVLRHPEMLEDGALETPIASLAELRSRFRDPIQFYDQFAEMEVQ